MPKVIFAGGELDSVAVISGSVTESTTAGSFDGSYARCSLLCGTSSDAFRIFFLDESNAPTTVTAGQTVFLHCEYYQASSGNTGRNIVALEDSSGQPWLALISAGSSAIGLFYNSGTGASPVWTQIGTNWSFSTGTRYIFDIELTLGSPHSARWSVTGSSVASGTFTQASLTSLDRAQFRNASTGSSPARFSQIMATEGRSTVGGKVNSRSASGAGSNSGWAGTYTDINESPLNDATVLTAGSAGLKSTFAYDDVTTPSGLVIGSVFLFSRAKNDGIAPANLKALCRRSSTDYATGNLSGMTTSFSPVGAQWATDPSTSGIWADSAFNAAEFGAESAT